MFGRHPRLAIDAFLGIDSDKSPVNDHSYVSGLQNRLKFAYSVALREAKKQSKKHKRSPVNDHSYVSGLQNRLKFAYSVALREAKKQGKKHKRYYDLRVREAELKPGDRVLVRNVGVRGKSKLADRCEKDVYTILSQPTSGIPIYEVRKENSKERSRVLHRNLLLPFMDMPLCKTTSQLPLTYIRIRIRYPIPPLMFPLQFQIR
jgi:hypothetical protein